MTERIDQVLRNVMQAIFMAMHSRRNRSTLGRERGQAVAHLYLVLPGSILRFRELLSELGNGHLHGIYDRHRFRRRTTWLFHLGAKLFNFLSLLGHFFHFLGKFSILALIMSLAALRRDSIPCISV